ncbi:hypothetical protein PPSIR1_31458 [Plesiocystis pacifica SIR-1]|uniref:Uncharacterized protein n=1 Tax=Plesiocystis pacifica SIR-1 TaxID=391625 RepID=A6GF32_9BACT|nr:hypothetical protein [Plesiocystis pacifica]EDM75491.1 hypothetical protein PPSIR1_31458 [Plesiocystis pacifica SIR-1]
MQIELLVVLVVIAVLLGLAVGNMVHRMREQKRLEEERAKATLSGRIQHEVRTGAQRLRKEATKATRKGMWWALRRRFEQKDE